MAAAFFRGWFDLERVSFVILRDEIDHFGEFIFMFVLVYSTSGCAALIEMGAA